jgi:Aspartyl protease
VKLRLEGRLPFVTATLQFGGRRLTLHRVLLDTGSAGSVFAADTVEALGIEPQGPDRIRRILGVGGSEFVYSKRVEALAHGEMVVEDFEIQVGAMRYGFPLEGIVGMDFLLATRAVIDLAALELRTDDLEPPSAGGRSPAPAADHAAVERCRSRDPVRRAARRRGGSGMELRGRASRGHFSIAASGTPRRMTASGSKRTSRRPIGGRTKRCRAPEGQRTSRRSTASEVPRPTVSSGSLADR